MTCVFITGFVLCCVIACSDEKPTIVPLPPAPIIYEPPPSPPLVEYDRPQKTGRITDYQLDHLEGQLEWLKRRLPDKGPPK